MSWFIQNIRAAQWHDEAGQGGGCFGNFERGERFPEFGLNLGVLQPGQSLGMYHREANQEGFLVLSGECLLIVEGEEHPLRAWDYFHCPAWTNHILVGAGDGPSFVIAVGGRTGSGDIVYPVDETAAKHGVSVEQETNDPKQAYGRFPKPQPVSFDEAWLP